MRRLLRYNFQYVSHFLKLFEIWAKITKVDFHFSHGMHIFRLKSAILRSLEINIDFKFVSISTHCRKKCKPETHYDVNSPSKIFLVGTFSLFLIYSYIMCSDYSVSWRLTSCLLFIAISVLYLRSHLTFAIHSCAAFPFIFYFYSTKNSSLSFLLLYNVFNFLSVYF